jgi:dTDP-4-amino-4,6-dideoxygalactose transaminase
MFSFHATKLFHTAEGGALTCKDTDLKRCIDLLKNFGIKNEDEVVMTGINGKMNEIQAALGLINLRYLEAEREKRKRIIDTYAHCLRGIDGITVHELPGNVRNSYQYFVVRIEQERFGISRDEVSKRLREYNVHARKYFYPLCSDYPCYKDLPSANPANLPVARRVVNEVLCLPLYGELAVSTAERICETIRSFRG